MNRKEIQELRDLADAIEADGAWALHNDATVTAALRACADREERAQAGVTDEVVASVAWAIAEADGDDPDRLIWQGSPPEPWGEAGYKYEAHARAALQSAALALQGDREKLRALVEKWRVHAKKHTPFARGAINNLLDDLSRAIGDSNER